MVTSSCVGSVPRALATGCCGSLFGGPGSSISDLAFSSERKKRTHLSRIRPLPRSSLPSSSRTYYNSTFFVSSSCIDVVFWKNPRWSPTRNCFSNSTTWRSKKRTIAALRTFLSQLHAFLTSFRSCAPLFVHFQALLGCVHRISHILQLRSHFGVSTPTLPWSLSLLGWDHQFRMLAAANTASTSSLLLFPGGFALRCFPTAVATLCRSWGSVIRRLRGWRGRTQCRGLKWEGRWTVSHLL